MTSSIANVGTSDVVGALTDISVSFQVTNEVPQDGYFELGLPKWNSGTQRTSLAQSMIEYDNSSSNFDISNGGYRVPCTSTDHSGILCVIQVAQPSTVEEISSMLDVLKVNGLSSSISAGGTFTFQTTDSSFKNPPSTKAVTTFSASSHSSGSNSIDAQSSGISYQVSTAATLSVSQVTVTTVNNSINEPEQFNFNIIMDLPLPVGAVFEITIPTEVSIYADDGTLLLTGASGEGSLFTSANVQILDATTQ